MCEAIKDLDEIRQSILYSVQSSSRMLSDDQTGRKLLKSRSVSWQLPGAEQVNRCKLIVNEVVFITTPAGCPLRPQFHRVIKEWKSITESVTNIK